MSKNLEKKLLAEAFDAIVNDNDIAKATRLFKRHWDLTAKTQYSLLESEDSEFEVSDMGDDFNEEIAADAGSEKEEKLEQALIAIDELEEKYAGEASDEVQGKFDELRNIVDEMKLAEDEEVSLEDAAVIIEDLKADFEVAGVMDEEVADLFDEVESAIQGEADVEEIDVADDESEFDAMDEEPVEEAEMPDVEFEEGEEADEEPVEDEFADEEPVEGEEADLEEIKDDVEDLLAKLEEMTEESEETIEEGWSNIADPRKKMTSEEEGVNKKGTMNFGKLRGLTLDKKAGLGTSASDSKGTSADKKAKVQSIENKGAKSWHKVEKPANKPADGKSLMGE